MKDEVAFLVQKTAKCRSPQTGVVVPTVVLDQAAATSLKHLELVLKYGRIEKYTVYQGTLGV
ncbi:hypothetical protein RvY_00733 [Ramazzottius varieornatus]|uniref:Uncharacterized protein n=1 Tax=Ramazzottius varieornatus TaxID=947166 RepID=A0A1D1UE93_RAMVA|nr:hypothetical protein RvY_00733 [Ramazzottius varieornatus]